MSMIQVRNVPEDLHRALKERAAREGVTLSELALTELQRSVEVPSVSEVRDRLSRLPRQSYNGESAAESVRRERDSR